MKSSTPEFFYQQYDEAQEPEIPAIVVLSLGKINANILTEYEITKESV
jgi:hypothetical protein